MKRYRVDKKSVAIYDTALDEYAPYLTVQRAAEDAGYLNEGIATKTDLGWMSGDLYRLGLEFTNGESEFDGNVPD